MLTGEFGENYVTLDHEMTKEHYVSFIACVSYNQMMMYKLYPEQEAEARFPRIPGAKWYVYCSRDGLIMVLLNPRYGIRIAHEGRIYETIRYLKPQNKNASAKVIAIFEINRL